MTTPRFIRFGPAPRAPRRPAVPNSSSPAKRSARSAAPPRVAALGGGEELRRARRAVVGVGVVVEPGPGGGEPRVGVVPVTVDSQPPHDLGEEARRTGSAAAWPASRTSSWLSGCV